MKQFLSILLVLVISVMAIPVLVSADSGTLYLVCKNPDTWTRVNDTTFGTLVYNTSGPTFDFNFTATGLTDGAYSLIYYANPYPGNFPGALIGTGVAAGGALTITGSDNFDMDLPTPPDSNMLVAHNVPPDNYAHAYGAKIWLVPSECYDANTKSVIVWSPTRFLFETDLITYTDTNKTGGKGISLTTVVTEPAAVISFDVDKQSLDFGGVAIGSCSASQIITITNIGNVPIAVTVTPSAGFYTTSLKLGNIESEVLATGGKWVTSTIAVDGNYSYSAIVCPLPGLSGTQTGTLTFIAEYATP
jgi:hypothetical protein